VKRISTSTFFGSHRPSLVCGLSAAYFPANPLHYCCPLWNPNNSSMLCSKIENVQRTFTRKIDGMSELDYWDRLKTLHLYSVQRRRERYIVIYMFKILHNLVPNCKITFRSNPRTGIHAVVPKLDRNRPSLALHMLENSFSYVGPLLYNSIPSALRKMYDNIDPVGTFKSQLDAFLMYVPDEPTVQGRTRRANSNSLIDQIDYRQTWFLRALREQWY